MTTQTEIQLPVSGEGSLLSRLRAGARALPDSQRGCITVATPSEFVPSVLGLNGFITPKDYPASVAAMPGEIGATEVFRFVERN